MSSPIRLGTRGSKLAMAQSAMVARSIEQALNRPVELVEITTLGDTSNAVLTQIGGTGVFASALRQSLKDGEIDCAVHSLKDLPTAPEPGLVLAAIPPREDPRDALVARDGLRLAQLPEGATIGTGSPRRVSQIHALGLGYQTCDIRGNVDSRVSMVTSGALDAVVLAAAGLRRVGLDSHITEMIDPLQVVPAPGQGALAVECRESDTDFARQLVAIDDVDTRAAVTAERSFLARLEAGCTAPVGALADVVEGDSGLEIYLRAAVTATDGGDQIRQSITGALEDAAELGRRLALMMLDDGAASLMTTTPLIDTMPGMTKETQ